MGKVAFNVFFSEGFEGIINNVDEIHVCSQEPANFTEATSTYSLGKADVSGSDFTEGDGDVSGRKLTIGAITVTGSGDGTGTHLALVDQVNDVIYYVTTCTSVGIENAVEQEFGAWDIEILDPT